MKLTRYNIFSFMLAAAFALTLAGCGGNGGTAAVDDTDTPVVPVVPVATPEEMCTAAGGTYADMTCTTAEMIAAAAETARIAAAAAATAAAGTKAKAIRAEQDQDPDAGIGGSVTVDEMSTYMLSEISRDRETTTVKIADTANAREKDPKFAMAKDLGEAGGYAGSMHVRTMDADDDGNVAQEVVVVRTDIAAPKATKFTTVHPINMDTGVNTNMENDTAGEDGTGATYEALTVDVSGNAEVTAAILKLVMAGAFVPGAGSTTALTFARAQADSDTVAPGAQKVAAFETAGTYDGADGTYKCNAADSGGTDCSVTLNAKGVVTAASEGWIFTPADGAMVYVADTSYLAYGFWLKRTTDKDGVLTYDEVETFTDGNVALTDVSNLQNVQGSAEYNGNATGVYVKNVLDSQANVLTATSGVFSAEVTLNANFGGGDVADNNQFTIGGTITKFALEHGEDNDWGVGLDLANFGTRDGEPGKSPHSGSVLNVFSADATGDSTAAKGSWNGGFFGVAADTPAADDTARIAPPHVTGEFNANFTDGTAAGAFGANK